MKNISKKTKVKLAISNSKFIITVLVLVLLILVAISSPSKPSNFFISSECNLSNISYGTDSMKISVAQSGNYVIWLHVETPVQISYNLSSDTYNPLFVGIDSKTCYKVGGGYIAQNSWTWINYLNSSSSDLFNTYLTQGSHNLTIVGQYLNIDQVEVLKPGCTPFGLPSCSALTSNS